MKTLAVIIALLVLAYAVMVAVLWLKQELDAWFVPVERPIRPVPALVVHSTDDELIPFHDREALHAAAEGPDAFLRSLGFRY